MRSRKKYLAAWQASHPKKCNEYSRRWRKKNPLRYWLMGAKANAKARGVKFNISLADLGLLPKICPVLGIRLSYEKVHGKGTNRRNAASIDRISSRRGYVRGNVVVVSLRANVLKKDATLKELQALARFYTSLARRAT